MSTPKYSRLDPEQRSEQILDAANALFAERGYDEVSVEDIANSAGVTRGLVHHYFGGRKEVYIALLERLGALREEQLPPPVGRSARARIADSVSRWLDWTEANRTIWLGTLGRGEDISPTARRQARRHRAAPAAPSAAVTESARTQPAAYGSLIDAGVLVEPQARRARARERQTPRASKSSARRAVSFASHSVYVSQRPGQDSNLRPAA